MTSYRDVHLRLYRIRGRASEYLCPCGRIAKDWSYQYSSSTPLFEEARGRSMVYSEDIDNDYKPLCRSCHVRFDMEHDPYLRKYRESNGKKVGDQRKEFFQSGSVEAFDQLSRAGKLGSYRLWSERREDPQFRERHSKAASENSIKARAALRLARESDPEHSKNSTRAMVEYNRLAAKGRECIECGKISNPPGMSSHQRSSGHSGIRNLVTREEKK